MLKSEYSWRDYLLWYGISALFLCIFVQPILQPAQFQGTWLELPRPRATIQVAMALLPALLAWLSLRWSSVSREEQAPVWTLSLVLAAICELLHFYVVDHGHYFNIAGNNTTWQLELHAAIMRLDVGVLPHSYRFLPDSIVEMLRWLSDDIIYSRIVYRLSADAVLFVFLYRFARLYLRSVSSGAVMVLVALVYPLSILHYAGQFVDPLSHLSFAVCFYAIASGYEPAFAPSLLVGIFAKESVAIMAVCRLVREPRRLRSWLAAGVYSALALATVAGIRLYVMRNTFAYSNVSGVGLEHVLNNLRSYPSWLPVYLLQLGVFVPGTVAGWRHADVTLKACFGIVLGAVCVSSLFFSWLAETRNLMPAIFPMAIINVRYVEWRVEQAFSAPIQSEMRGGHA